MIHGRGGLYPQYYTPDPVLDYLHAKTVYGNPPYGGTMSDLNEVKFTHVRRIDPPSLWRRLLWWLGPHFTICNLVLFAFCFYMVWQIGAWARSGAMGAGW